MKRILTIVFGALAVLLVTASAAMASDISAGFARSSLTGLTSPGYAPDNDIYLKIKSLNAAGPDVYSHYWTGESAGGSEEVFVRHTFYDVNSRIIASVWFRAWWDKPCYICSREYHDGQA